MKVFVYKGLFSKTVTVKCDCFLFVGKIARKILYGKRACQKSADFKFKEGIIRVGR